MCQMCIWNEPLVVRLDHPACYQCPRCGYCIILPMPKENTVPREVLEADHIAREWAKERGLHRYQADHVAERVYDSLVGWPVVYRN